MMAKKPRVLKLSADDEEKELEFELDYLSSLTFEERLQMMREKSREMLKQMIDHGHRRSIDQESAHQAVSGRNRYSSFCHWNTVRSGMGKSDLWNLWKRKGLLC